MELKIEKVLKDKGIEYRLIELSQNAFTVADVIAHSNNAVNPDEICKTIILVGRKSGNMIAVMLKGLDKVDFSKVKKLTSEDMTIASPEKVKEASGVEPGAVCPFLITVPLFVDQEIMSLERINCGSGHHLRGLEFNVIDLKRGVDYKVAGLSKQSI